MRNERPIGIVEAMRYAPAVLSRPDFPAGKPRRFLVVVGNQTGGVGRVTVFVNIFRLVVVRLVF